LNDTGLLFKRRYLFMINFTKNTWLRGFIFLMLFVGVIKVMHNFETKRTTSNPTNHYRSDESFTVHEVDQTVLDAIDALENQIDTAINVLATANTVAHTIDRLSVMRTQLMEMKEKYSKNSSSMAFLGPIGTAAIVLKERKIEKKLLATVNTFGNLLHNLIYTPHDEQEYPHAKSIQIGLSNTQKLVETVQLMQWPSLRSS